MSTVTMELSDVVADALTTPEGMKRAQALLEAEFGRPELDPAMIESARRGIADMQAGRVSPLEEAHARARAGFLKLVEEHQKNAA
jgi:hypothetical protein